MRNHIVSIVTFISLIIGITLISVKDWHESPVSTGGTASNVSLPISNQHIDCAAFSAISSCSFSSSTTTQSEQHHPQSLFFDSTDYYRSFNCILTNDAFQVNTSFVKNLKLGLNYISAALSANLQRDTYDKRYNNCYLFSLNATRYSSKYYVYALEHILI